jgi:GNAT superfamily N-acetyltransferase
MSDYRLSDDRAELDLDLIHGFLSQTYWSPNIPRETVERAIEGSHVVGAYDDRGQIGFARVITDHATFAYLADVFVLPGHRGKGIATAMVRHLQDHPALQGLRRWLLVTRDAQPVYAALGWTPIAGPERFMERHDPDVYAR